MKLNYVSLEQRKDFPPQQMHSQIGYNCISYPHCVFSNVVIFEHIKSYWLHSMGIWRRTILMTVTIMVSFCLLYNLGAFEQQRLLYETLMCNFRAVCFYNCKLFMASCNNAGPNFCNYSFANQVSTNFVVFQK